MKNEVQLFQAETRHLKPRVLRLALTAYINAKNRGFDEKDLITIIDYSMPSNMKRLWVLDVATNETLFHTYVSHGQNSGRIKATMFSNVVGSHKSSIGVFITQEPYFGKHGYSLTLKGMEYGINDNAYIRHIVIHGAWYVDKSVIKKYGLLGRTYGCPAVNLKLAAPIIDTIKDNTLLFVYYPDQYWLNHSRFLAIN